MRVFITGASGFIGSSVAGAFRRAGHRVVGLVRNPDKARRLVADEIEVVRGDLGEPAAWMVHAERADVLVHCAQDGTAEMIARDRAAIDALLTAARVAGVHGQPRTVLYTSGVWVYGSTGERVADETSPLDPIPIVGWRIDHEKLVLAAHNDGVRTLVLRPGCVYGKSGSLTSFWFASGMDGEVEVMGDGRNRWSLIHCDDVGAAYHAAAHAEVGGRALNLVDGSRHRVDELAAAVAAACGVPGRFHHLSEIEAHAKVGPLAHGLLIDQQVDGTASERLLDWRPRHRNFVEDADLYLAAWRAHQ